jgi:hypothetical protein
MELLQVQAQFASRVRPARRAKQNKSVDLVVIEGMGKGISENETMESASYGGRLRMTVRKTTKVRGGE